MRTPMVDAFGTTSCRSSSRLASSVAPIMLVPVTLASGRLRLVTSPVLTGSAAVMKTIGMVDVAALAARPGSLPPAAMTKATCRLTSSAARPGNRIVATFGPAIFDLYILAFDVSGFPQALAGRGHQIDLIVRRSAAEKSDDRHR